MAEGPGLPALIAQLLLAGVSRTTIDEAIYRVERVRLGESFSGDDRRVAQFAIDRAARIERWERGA